MNKFIKIGLACITNRTLLLCRPFAFNDLILPGGQRDANETDIECLVREIEEELGPRAELDVVTLQYFGTFEDIAASYKEQLVQITLYLGRLHGPLKPSSEIKELVWFSPSDDRTQLSPIIRNKILPALKDAGLL